ncbi:CRISPR-associated protein Cas4 [Actinomadura atramentaria]|uniref:CRISPR-associated protein Cas4 n=1 Tax=Actinomadura atramentaria TaxID=1990 RepID=UPI00036B000A|nr:CRISPR-associated protein Cas4 [Actinomadura atramentaria]
MRAADIGGVHIKYLHHCERQLWLFARGFRPEFLSAAVQLGEAVHETSYRRDSPVDLGAAQLDHLDGAHWVHEVKSSNRPSDADRAQVVHYCFRLHEIGVPAAGGILKYPKTRRTEKVVYGPAEQEQAVADIDRALAVAHQSRPPSRRARSACRGCGYFDYCWSE